MPELIVILAMLIFAVVSICTADHGFKDAAVWLVLFLATLGWLSIANTREKVYTKIEMFPIHTAKTDDGDTLDIAYDGFNVVNITKMFGIHTNDNCILTKKYNYRWYCGIYYSTLDEYTYELKQK